jgi:hypothetical protein
MIWTIYKYTKTRTDPSYEELGEIEAPHQPAALKSAMERFPNLFGWSPDYPNGRLLVRPKGDHRGMPGWRP